MSFNTADMVISTNESYRSIAIERGGKNPKDVHVVRSGPDLSRMKIVPAKPALKHGRKYLVGYVGVMGKQEGIDLLLQAVQLIVKHLGRTDIHFGLVGGGTELPAMRELAKQLGVAEYVTFTGRAPDSELLEMLNTADICVNPDRANDMNDRSTMNKIMEYMALGKPVVQFDLTEGRVSAAFSSSYLMCRTPTSGAKKPQDRPRLSASDGLTLMRCPVTPWLRSKLTSSPPSRYCMPLTCSDGTVPFSRSCGKRA
jgi:glycosyltransferase involved in cell wall biosynthesis